MSQTKPCPDCEGGGNDRKPCRDCDGTGECECQCRHVHECPKCEGDGWFTVGPCPTCQGTGSVLITEAELEASGQLRAEL